MEIKEIPIKLLIFCLLTLNVSNVVSQNILLAYNTNRPHNISLLNTGRLFNYGTKKSHNKLTFTISKIYMYTKIDKGPKGEQFNCDTILGNVMKKVEKDNNQSAFDKIDAALNAFNNAMENPGCSYHFKLAIQTIVLKSFFSTPQEITFCTLGINKEAYQVPGSINQEVKTGKRLVVNLLLLKYAQAPEIDENGHYPTKLVNSYILDSYNIPSITSDSRNLCFVHFDGKNWNLELKKEIESQ